MTKKKTKGAMLFALSALLLTFCFTLGVKTINNTEKTMAITEDKEETCPTQGPEAPTVSAEAVSYVEIGSDGKKYAVTGTSTVAVTPTSTGTYLVHEEATPSNNDILSANDTDTASQVDDWDEDDVLGTAAYVPK